MFAKKISSMLFNKVIFQMEWNKKKKNLSLLFYHAAD